MDGLDLEKMVLGALEDESDKTAFAMIGMLYPEWIRRKKQRYPNADGYDLYKQIFADIFECNIERISMEPDRGIDFAAMERKIKLMELNRQLEKEEKKKKEKRK